MNNEKERELRFKAIETIRILVEKDELMGVKFFKLKILSNLLVHTF